MGPNSIRNQSAPQFKTCPRCAPKLDFDPNAYRPSPSGEGRYVLRIFR